MKAIGYYEPQAISLPNALLNLEVPEPVVLNDDLLIEVKAVSVNPIDYKVRKSRKGNPNHPVILGWDAAGIVIKKGNAVTDFEIGDEVFYAGDFFRMGSNAQFQAVDHRIVGKKPKNLTFSAAAALPLTSLTAYEALFEKLHVPTDRDCNVLIIGGAGGVGSITIQLLKQLTQTTVYATYGRAASLEWLQSLHVDGLIDRHLSLKDHYENGSLPELEFIFSTTHTDQYLPELPDIIAPFGQLCIIDSPQKLDINPFKSKAASVHWEAMFAKSMYKYNMESQGTILNKIAKLVEEGKIHSTIHTTMHGLNVENFVTAHKILESSESIGKISIAL